MMSITDQELRDRLIALGYNPPPITGTSRNILLKKLKALETGTKMDAENTSDAESFDKKNPNGFESNCSTISNPEKRQHKEIKPEFTPIINTPKQNVKRDFWDRIGVLGVGMFLIGATLVVFFIFQFIGDWSDRRYRNYSPSDLSYPLCDLNDIKDTCIPESEAKFTESNINVVRASLHHIIASDHCKRKERTRTPEFMGMYPVLKDSQLQEILIEQLGFSENESEILARNSKVIFESNPRYDVKVLGNGFIYKNYRLLRSCGYMPWGDYVYTYSLYAIASFTAVWLTYRLNLWVSKLRKDDPQEVDYYVNIIIDVLRQAQEHQCNVTVEQMRNWLITPEDQIRRPQIWKKILAYVEKHQPGLKIKNENINGCECKVFSFI